MARKGKKAKRWLNQPPTLPISQTSMSKLPTEMVMEIAKYLDFKSLGLFSLTNSTFSAIGDALRFEQFKIQLPVEQTTDERNLRKFRNKQRLFSRKKKNIKHLTVIVEEYKKSDQEALSWLREQLSTCKKLRSLKCDWDFETLPCGSLENFPCLKQLTIPGALASQIFPPSLEELVVYRVDEQRPHQNFATIKDLPNLRSLEINFEEDTHQNNNQPLIDLSSLPKLEKMTLSSGRDDRDCNGGSINPFIVGHTDSVHTLTVKGCGQDIAFEGDNGRSGLWRLIQPFKNIRRLVLWGLKCNDTLSNVSLPKLETLEVQWCTLGLQQDMNLPCLENFSASIPMNPPNYDLRKEIGPFLERVNILILILEYDVCKLVPWEHAPRNINEVYQILENRHTPPQACLIEGDITAPRKNHKWMRFLSRRRDPSEHENHTKAERRQRKKRRRLLRQLGIEGVFQPSFDQFGN